MSSIQKYYRNINKHALNNKNSNLGNSEEINKEIKVKDKKINLRYNEKNYEYVIT